METLRRDILFLATLLALFAGCFFYGGSQSPLRFYFFLVLPLFSIYLAPRTIIFAGILFTFCQLALLIYDSPGTFNNLTGNIIELSSYLLTTIAFSRIIATVNSDHERYKIAESTFQGLSNDLTQQTLNLQTTLNALSKANSKLQEIDRNKTVFLGNVAHELRTPLSAIRSYSEILQNYNDIDEQTRQEFLKIIQSESIRLSNLINDVLSISKIESGKMDQNITQVNAARLIEECIKVMSPMAQEKGLLLETEIADENCCVLGDKNQLLQVLLNLVHNAIKFTNSGSICVGLKPNSSFIEFYVRDTGEGIYPEEQEKIFEEFYRILGNVPNRPVGSGLGLSICKNIVEHYGGSIRVESEVGKGSTFRFTIPLNTQQNLDSIPAAVNTKLHHPTDFRPFLVVTNNTVKRQYLRKSLEELGYITMAATSNSNARSLANRMPSDLVIADVCNGTEELLNLDSWTRAEGIPLFVAFFHVHRNGSISMAIDDYISKSLGKEQILTTVSRLKKPRGKIAILSPDNNEARIIQVTLGIEGYKTVLFSDFKAGTEACADQPPDGIIIGSYAESSVEDIVDRLMEAPQTVDIPRFMVIDMRFCNHAKLINVPAQSGRPMAHGLSPLITKIESELF